MKLRYLYFTVFISGMTTLAVELTASRLLGAVFGTSNLVWASVIGLILIYLTLGYFIGGSWADRSPYEKTMYTILAWGAFTAGVVPLLSKSVLPLAASAFDDLQIGILAGSFTGVLILFSIPITLLGTISPFAIRLAIEQPDEAGRVSGRVYAISTLGSFLGTFLPVLVLIPLIGTSLTFLFFSLLLMAVAFLGLILSSAGQTALRLAWMPILLVVATLIWGNTPFKRTSGQVLEVESAYNYIEVLEQDGYTLLRLNEGQGVHSVYHPTILRYFGPWEQFLVAPFFYPDIIPSDVERIGIVGLAAGTTARQATAVYGPIPIDGWELDPEIISIGSEYFGMALPNLNAIPLDGRWGLNQSSQEYTIIGVDAYRPPYIPWHLTTVEFFEIVRDHLSERGTLVINVGRAPGDRRLIFGLVGTLKELFPSIYVMDIPNTFNSIIYATRHPTTQANFLDNYANLQEQSAVHPLLLEVMAAAIQNLREAPNSDIVFTDDLAPIEWLTNSMVINFLWTGGVDELQ